MVFILGAAVGSIITMGVIVLWSIISTANKLSRLEEEQAREEAASCPYKIEPPTSEAYSETAYTSLEKLPVREPMKKRHPKHTNGTPKHSKN